MISRIRQAFVAGAAISVLAVAPVTTTADRTQQNDDRQDPSARLIVRKPVNHGRSPRLSSYVTPEKPGSEHEAPPVRETAKPSGGGGGGGSTDSLLQTVYPPANPPLTLASFDGIAWTGSVPPDTNAAVGDTQVVEVVNTQFAIYSKAGALQAGPAEMRQMFAGLTGDECGVRLGGDPVVLYDRLAGRWLLARYLFATNHLCVALSQTSDAAGAYFLYSYYFGPNTADYPKFGVWPDGYYFSANTFAANDGPFMGGQACAFDRAAMLSGLAGTLICYQGSSQWRSLLPADVDSAMPPPAGAPNYFLQLDSDALALYKFRPNFTNPSASSFTGPTKIRVGKWTNGCCIPQRDVTETLESLSGRLMYRLSYRNFGTYESLLATHTVQIRQTGSGTQTGIRWYELRTPGGTPSVFQQSTYSPDGTTYRWMPSIAQDRLGNVFLGYSASSASVFPSVRFTVRLAGDPRSQMQPEQIVQHGLGSQVVSPNSTTGRNRWGDYASVSVDPIDGCTLWFATEYLASTGYNNWVTRLHSVRFPSCGP